MFKLQGRMMGQVSVRRETTDDGVSAVGVILSALITLCPYHFPSSTPHFVSVTVDSNSHEESGL